MSGRRPAPGASARHRAREVLFRVVYQAGISGDAFSHAWDQQEERARMSPDQVELVGDVVGHLDRHAADVDATLQAAASHWPIDRMSATDRSVLRVAIAEFAARPGTPARVVIDEAVELAKRYGSEASGAFVNGILDRIARDMRAGEF
jgi:N utilization substance protein B